MSRVVALGGAGGMGRAAVRKLADVVDELVVADLHGADEVAERHPDHVTAARIDVTDDEALAELLRGADLVLNTVGPFVRFGPVVLRAAISARVDYADICDDFGPTREMLDTFDEPAREAGVRAVVGIGASPGISNLIARWAYDRLDDVTELHTAWVAGGDEGGLGGGDADGGAHAALEHMLLGAAGTIPVFDDGDWTEIPAFREPVEVNFPGTGPYHCYPIGHPEPVTLPRFLPGLRRSVNFGALAPSGLNELVRLEADRIASGEVDAQEATRDFLRRAAAEPERWLRHQETGAGGLCAFAIGTLDDRRVRLSVAPGGFPRGGMATITGYPLAIAAEMLLAGEVDRTGVLAPEAAFEPRSFLEAFSPDWDLRLSEDLVAEELEELG